MSVVKNGGIHGLKTCVCCKVNYFCQRNKRLRTLLKKMERENRKGKSEQLPEEVGGAENSCPLENNFIQTELIRGVDRSTLTLFFSGWATDGNLIKSLFAECATQPQQSQLQQQTSDGQHISVAPPNDILVCYNYNGYLFNPNLIEGYSRIKLMAWSLGVWAAEFATGLESVVFDEAVALNGTTTPIDEQRGIPPAIYTGTLNGLNERNLYKFRRRMCGSTESYNAFMQFPPQRTMESIKGELAAILTRSQTKDWTSIPWSKAIICTQDAIFPPDNQANAWNSLNEERVAAEANLSGIKEIEICLVEQPHFPAALLKSLL